MERNETKRKRKRKIGYSCQMENHFRGVGADECLYNKQCAVNVFTGIRGEHV